MCGIAGFIGINKKTLLVKMLQIQQHRGPDKLGYYYKNGIGIGNVRLSIIDISDRGNQPIYNEKRNILVVFNGEIYNYNELKENLIQKKHKFYSKTDTEVIVHLYEEYGNKFINYLNGMFGIALLDLKNKKLILARDRLGIKPLYYSIFKKGLIFASETKAILLYKKFELNNKAIDNYLSYRYVTDNEMTMFKDIKKVMPGQMVIYSYHTFKFKKILYWDIHNRVSNIFKLSERDKFEYFLYLINDSVKKRMIADVPLGVFLSSGVDSSFIAYIMSRYSNKPIKTFSIGFGTDIDETKEVFWFTKVIKSTHYQLKVEKQDVCLLEKIVWYFDEPLGDAIIIPMYLLSRYARKEVKVVLTGEGADEIFSGYIHHFALYYGEKIYKILPKLIRKILYDIVSKLPPQTLNYFFPYPAFLGETGKQRLLKYMKNPLNLSLSYFNLTTLFSPEDKNRLYTREFINLLKYNYSFDNNIKEIKKIDDIPIYDIKHWLTDNILYKQDRTSMAVSLESRVPYLDHRIVEFIMSLKLSEKIKKYKSKYFLRKVTKHILPNRISNRPKKAFYIPIEKVFGPKFHQLLFDTLSSERIKKRKIFNYNYIKYLINNYNLHSSEILYTKQLMAIFILELWMQNYIDKGLK